MSPVLILYGDKQNEDLNRAQDATASSKQKEKSYLSMLLSPLTAERETEAC